MHELLCQAVLRRGLRRAVRAFVPNAPRAPGAPLATSRSHRRQPGERSFEKRALWYPGEDLLPPLRPGARAITHKHLAGIERTLVVLLYLSALLE